MKKVRRKNKNIFSKYFRYYSKRKPLMNNLRITKHEVFLTLFFTYFLSSVITLVIDLLLFDLNMNTMLFIANIIVLIFLLVIFGKVDRIKVYLNGFCFMIYVTALASYLLSNGYENNPTVMFWAGIAVIAIMVHNTMKVGIIGLLIFMLTLISTIPVEIVLFKNIQYHMIINIVITIAAVEIGMFLSIKVLLTNLQRSNSMVTKLSKKLEEKEKIIISQEKTVVLSEIINNITYEINSPTNAVRVLADICVDSTENVIKNLLQFNKYKLKEDSIIAIQKLLNILIEEVKKENPKDDIHKTNKSIAEVLEENEIVMSNDIVNSLSKLGIYNSDIIDGHIDIFKREDILEILKCIIPFYDIINGVYIIQSSAVRTTKILNSLKAFVDENVNDKLMEIDIIHSLNTVLNLYCLENHPIEVIKDYEQVPNVCGRKNELSQVWVNIISNAIYAMKDDGLLTVSLKNLNNKYVRVLIRDTGMGIDAKDISKVFDYYYTTKKTGSGLGLNVAKKIVENHKGSITIDSEVNEGTTVIVTLPVMDS